MLGQRISTIRRTRLVEDDKGEVGQEEGPVGLTMVQALFRSEIEKVNMV